MGYLEVACFNAEAALLAAKVRVGRIELCADRHSGGVTPPLDLLRDLRARVPASIPINVMIRPRGGDFVYSKHELQDMVSSIKAMKPHCDGFVFGLLKEDKTVDVDACSELVKQAEGLPCTFHRAFDETRDLLKALEEVIGCGFKTILTSGGPGNAADNIPMLSLLLAAANWDPLNRPESSTEFGAKPGPIRRIEIMPGGGVRHDEIEMLQRSGVKSGWYHTSGIVGGGEITDETELQEAKWYATRYSTVPLHTDVRPA